MLISHRKQFIFTKTRKTAGTSVESYFEQYCMPEGQWTESHRRKEYTSEAGIIGHRARDIAGTTWYNHMPAKMVRDQIGLDIWNAYFKFTVVRNPFDRLISEFFHRKWAIDRYTRRQRWQAFGRRLLGRGTPEDRIRGKTDIEQFRSWLHHGGSCIDRGAYVIDDEVCVDYFIRYEELAAGVEHVCNRVGVPFVPDQFPTFKSGMRHQEIPIRAYYDSASEAIARDAYAWELDYFNYDMPT